MNFILRYGGASQLRVVATAVHKPGDLVVYAGFVGAYCGERTCAIGDTITITLDAVGEAATASGTTFAAGALVYWDTVNKLCVTGAGANIIKLGTAVYAKTSGQLVTTVKMNTIPLV